jgi:hypothetical protein
VGWVGRLVEGSGQSLQLGQEPRDGNRLALVDRLQAADRGRE